jgi:ferredoxin-NADP reductase
MRVKLDHVRPEATDIRTFFFSKPENFRYTAGQFIELYLPHRRPDERGQKHWFTLSSSPSQPLLSITTRNFGAKGSTFKKALFGLSPGDSVEISAPMGDFVLPKDKAIPLVFVAGGIGVTPFHSIVQWLHDSNEQRKIRMFYAAENEDDLIFLDLFKTYNLELHTIVGEGLTAASITDDMGSVDDKLVFISGPEPMTEALVGQLKQQGFLYEQLVTDYFPGYSAI